MVLDLLLKNARIVDGTGAPWFRGAVGVEDGTITTVRRETSPNITANETFNLGDMILAPGFIDTHSHSDLILFDEPTLTPKIRQGVTTEILGQDGFSMAPMFREGGSEEWEEHLSGLDGRADCEWGWGSISNYLDAIAENGLASNVATLVGHGTVRFNILGMDDRHPSESELNEMAGLVTEALEEGAIGLSTGLVYTPQTNAETHEVQTLASQLRPYGRPFVAHIRNESDEIWSALDEFIEIGAETGVPLHISHFKLVDRPQHGKAERILNRFEIARERGIDITADQYPYCAGSTMLASHLPPWARTDGSEQTLDYLKNESSRTRIRDYLEEQREDWNRVVVSYVASEENNYLEGMSIEEIADDYTEDPITVIMDLLLEERLEVSRIRHMSKEEDVQEILKHERTAVATDGLLVGNPHPRSYGTYPRVLGHYTRDENLFSVEEAVRMMTSLPARAMGLHQKGVIRTGMDADFVVFDPSIVESPATYQDPKQYPEGMPHVFVGGTFVVRDGEVTAETPGDVIRKGVSDD